METIKCKECNKELSKKAEICPNCGYRIKNKSFIKQLGIVFLGIILFIIIVLLIFVIWYGVERYQKNKIVEQYAGVWTLKSDTNQSYTIEHENFDTNLKIKEKIKILLDKKLIIKKENVYYGIGNEGYCADFSENKKITERCPNNTPQVYLSQLYKNKVGINFSDENGDPIILCFKLQNKRTLEQISCENVGGDELNPSLYSNNGGIDEKLNISYVKE